MPDPRRLLGSEQSPYARAAADLVLAGVARYSPEDVLRVLIATAPVDAPPAAPSDAPADTPPADTPPDPQAPPPAERTPQDQTFDPPAGGVPFTIPAVVLEGWNTSDDRYIEPGSLGRRDMPQTIMAMLRNPDGGFEGHSAAIACGRIDTMERVDFSAEINRETGEPFGDGVWGWRATGYLVPHDDQPGTQATVDYVRDQVLRGVSVDLAEVEADTQVLEEDEDGFPERVRFVVTQGSIAQCTITPFAAFPSAYIVLDEGQGADDADATPPEQPTEEPAPPPVAASALRILQPARGRQALVASLAADTETIAPLLPPREWFTRVDVPDPARHVYLGRHPSGVPTGQVWGYLAQWDVPHAGILDREVYAPRLGPAGYRTFASHGSVLTAENEEVSTGIVTFGCGHDMDFSHGVVPALEHYDNAGSAYADIVVGEDDFGVWFAGAMRPHLTRQQIEEFGRHPVSGDWRANPGDVNVRLVAALCVNTPGFPIRGRAHITASGVRTILAAGSAPLVRRQRRTTGTDPDEVRRVVDERMRPVLTQAARAGLARHPRP
jgi:hypothetical protein